MLTHVHIHRASIDDDVPCLTDNVENIVFIGTQLLVRFLGHILRRLHRWLFGGQWAAFAHPLLPPAIEQAHIGMTIDFELPERQRRREIAQATLKDNGIAVRNSGLRHHGLESRSEWMHLIYTLSQ
jgi:hypothetical protein